jgi:hypothetical protein
MYAKIQCMDMHDFLINSLNIWLLKILYKTIIHKQGFSEA